MGRSLKTTTPTHCHVRHVRKSELDSVRRAKSTTSRVSKELPPPSTEPRHYHSPSSLVLTDFNHRSSTRNSHAKSDLMPRIHSVSSQFMLPSPQIEMRCLSVKEINPRTPTVTNSGKSSQRNTRVSPDSFDTAWMDTNEKSKRKSKRKRCAWSQLWPCLCLCFLLALLLGAIAALAAVLESQNAKASKTVATTRTTTSTTSTTSQTTTSTTSTATTSTTSTSSTSTATTSTSSTSSTSTSTSTSTTSTTTTSRTTSTTSTSTTTSRTTSTTSSSTTTTRTTSSTSTTTTRTTSTQSTTVTTRPMTTPDCTSSGFGLGKLMQQFGATPTSWTKSTLSYTATNYTDPVLLFGFETSNNYHYLDGVSVVDAAAPTVELLDNPSFENATSFLAGWKEWCASTCSTLNTNGAPGERETGFNCQPLTGSCLQVSCEGNGPAIYFIAQSFTATIGHTYTISFWQKHIGSGSNEFYVDIV